MKNRLVIETQTIRDGWRMMVALSSTINKSIAYAFRYQEERGEWLRPFALQGNSRFYRLSLPMGVSSTRDSLHDPLSDSLHDPLSDSPSDSPNEAGVLQSLIHKESVIHVLRHSAKSESEEEKEAVVLPALPAVTPVGQSAVKREMVKRIKQFLFAADLDTVRPCDVHQFIQSQFSCYREHRDKYRAFVNDTILVCYGQMDHASCILPGLFLGSECNAADLEWLKAAGVRTIVNVSIEIPCFYEDQFLYHRILWEIACCMRCSVDDLPEVDLSAYFDQAFEWIDSSLNEKKPVFVHCQVCIMNTIQSSWE